MRLQGWGSPERSDETGLRRPQRRSAPSPVPRIESPVKKRIRIIFSPSPPETEAGKRDVLHSHHRKKKRSGKRNAFAALLVTGIAPSGITFGEASRNPVCYQCAFRRVTFKGGFTACPARSRPLRTARRDFASETRQERLYPSSLV